MHLLQFRALHFVYMPKLHFIIFNSDFICFFSAVSGKKAPDP